MSQSRSSEQEQPEQLGRTHRDLSRMMRQGRSFSGLERHCVFLNTGATPAGGGRFATVSAVSGLDFPDDGRAVAFVDWDHDGDLDVWISNRNAPRIRLMRNDTPQAHHYLGLRLIGNGTTTNREAVGARVEIVTGEDVSRKQIRTVRAGEGFLGQSSTWVHFGLGNRERVEGVVVRWPGGATEEFGGLRGDRRYVLVQGTGSAAAAPGRPTPAALKPSILEIPAATQSARIPLLTPIPKTSITYENLTGAPEELLTGRGRPVLVNLWASWCQPCLEELAEFTAREADIRGTGMGLLALSVDGLGDDRSDPAAAGKILDRLGYPFPRGRATRSLVQDLQTLHNFLIPLERPLPVPASFLFDEEGRLAVIYKGRTSVDDVLGDLEHSRGTWANRLERAAPLPGRVIRHPFLDRSADAAQAYTLFHVGTFMDDSGRREDALAAYGDVLRLNPGSFLAHYNLGRIFQAQGQYLFAMNHYEKAVSLNPDLTEAHVGLGSLMMRKGDLERASGHYRSALRGDQDNPEILTNLGVAYAGMGDWNKAAGVLQQAIRVDPDFVEARYNLGVVFMRQGLDDRAADQFMLVARIAPSYAGARHNLGLIAEQQGDLGRAAQYYEGELRVNPESAKTHNNLGSVLEQQGDSTAALTHYERAIQIDPTLALARENLARLRGNTPKTP